MKNRIPFIYLVAMIIVSFLSIYMLGFWMEWFELQDTGALIQTYLFTWGIVIAFAILGGILFGMIFGHRILSARGFTPIEKGLLEATLEMKKSVMEQKEHGLIPERSESINDTQHSAISELAGRISTIESKMDLILQKQGLNYTGGNETIEPANDKKDG